MTLMVGLIVYLLQRIQSIYIQYILVLFCLLYIFAQLLFILPTYGTVLCYRICTIPLANTICIMYIIFPQLIILVIMCYILLLPNKALISCLLACLWNASSLLFECLFTGICGIGFEIISYLSDTDMAFDINDDHIEFYYMDALRSIT